MTERVSRKSSENQFRVFCVFRACALKRYGAQAWADTVLSSLVHEEQVARLVAPQAPAEDQ